MNRHVPIAFAAALLLGASGPEPAAPAPDKPDLLLMTGLPIVWGEGGAFDAESRPFESYRYLEQEFSVRPIDAIEPAGLQSARLMLLAQPRLLAPEELAVLDAWVRRGGRLLVLTDPRLVWPTELPLGDIRRPPALPLLGPLLRHWGLRLEEAAAGPSASLSATAGARRLAFAAPDWGHAEPPGRFVATGSACRVEDQAWLARCRIGRGETLLVADADLLHDDAWLREDASGRRGRTADNPLVVADWLDSLAGIDRPRAEPRLAGPPPAQAPGPASPAEEPETGPRPNLLWLGFLMLATLAAGLGMHYRRRRRPTDLSTGRPH